jgi:hypothetical protein
MIEKRRKTHVEKQKYKNSGVLYHLHTQIAKTHLPLRGSDEKDTTFCMSGITKAVLAALELLYQVETFAKEESRKAFT